MKNNFVSGFAVGIFIMIFGAVFFSSGFHFGAMAKNQEPKESQFARIKFGFNPDNAKQTMAVVEGKQLRISDYHINRNGQTNYLTLDVPFTEVDFSLFASSDDVPPILTGTPAEIK